MTGPSDGLTRAVSDDLLSDLRIPSLEGEQPTGVPCASCDSVLEWTWLEWVGKYADSPRIAPRWIPPATDRCPECRDKQVRSEREAWVRDRLVGFGCDHELMQYSWERYTRQARGEDFADFVARIKACDQRTIGVTPLNWLAFLVFRDWRPGRRGYSSEWPSLMAGDERKVATVAPHWIYACGDVGGGKSMWLTLLLRQLLSEPIEWSEVPGSGSPGYAPRLRRAGGYAVHFWVERELQDAMNRFRRDREHGDSPLDRAKKIQVLFLDDLGTAKRTESWLQDIAMIIDYRYRHKLSTVITGNLPYEGLKSHYKNDRMISRIGAMVRGTELVLDAKPDWRTMYGTGGVPERGR